VSTGLPSGRSGPRVRTTGSARLRRRGTPLLTGLLFGLLLPGCFLLRRQADDTEYEPAPITVVVENRNWNQVAIYVEAGGPRVRLGEIPGPGTVEFVLPGMFTHRTTIRLSAFPLASRESYRTEPIHAQPGAAIHVSIENNLRLSSWFVR
jgi:hypothetical protein